MTPQSEACQRQWRPQNIDPYVGAFLHNWTRRLVQGSKVIIVLRLVAWTHIQITNPYMQRDGEAGQSGSAENPEKQTAISPSTSRSRVSDRTQCHRWIRERAKNDERPRTRGELWKEAQNIFKDLSERSFNKAWDSAAPDEWKRPGRRPKSSKTVS
jgi:hypothetical protein